MIAFMFLGSSELQPWAIKHTNIRSINVSLLASMHRGFEMFEENVFLF